MSADPLAVHSQGADFNAFAYVLGAVLKATDPLGLAPCQSGCRREADETPDGEFARTERPAAEEGEPLSTPKLVPFVPIVSAGAPDFLSAEGIQHLRARADASKLTLFEQAGQARDAPRLRAPLIENPLTASAGNIWKQAAQADDNGTKLVGYPLAVMSFGLGLAVDPVIGALNAPHLFSDGLRDGDAGSFGSGGLAAAAILPVGRLKLAGSAVEESVSMYRAVSAAEFHDVMKTGAFRAAPGGGSLAGKQFGLKLGEVLKFADHYPELAAVLKVDVPKSTFAAFDFSKSIDPFIFKSGVVTVQPGAQQMLLNQTILSLKHAF